MAVQEFYSGKILYPAIGVLIALSALFGLAILPRFSPAHGGLVGKPAPAVTLPVIANGDAGARIDLASLKGHAVVLDFWATWCGPCAVEAPILDRLQRRYANKGLMVVGVNVSDSPEAVKAYAHERGLSYTMVSDAEGGAQRDYDVTKLPSLVVIDREGRVASFAVGITDESALDDMIAAAM
jgi:thiol-disulfide isomerase/thioredoxin